MRRTRLLLPSRMRTCARPRSAWAWARARHGEGNDWVRRRACEPLARASSNASGLCPLAGEPGNRGLIVIGRLKGTVVHKQPPWLVVDVHGVGYELEAPMSTFYDLPEVGREVVLFTHYAQK